MLINDNGTSVTVRVTKDFQELLRDHHVYTLARSQDECRWEIDKDRVSFLKTCIIEPFVGFHVGNQLCSMGSFTYSNSALSQELTVGRYCSIAKNVETITAEHPHHSISTSSFFYDTGMSSAVAAERALGYTKRRTRYELKPAPRIGNDVWIGSDVAINRGADIGDGSVIARKAMVTRPVAPYSMVGGNPAKLLRNRFQPPVVAGLSASEWWKYSPADLQNAPRGDPETFIVWLEEHAGKMTEYRPEPLRLWDEVKRLG